MTGPVVVRLLNSETPRPLIGPTLNEAFHDLIRAYWERAKADRVDLIQPPNEKTTLRTSEIQPPNRIPDDVLLELATRLGVDSKKLARKVPEILVRGSGSFGPKRLQIYRNAGQLYARVWIGSRCLYDSPVPE